MEKRQKPAPINVEASLTMKSDWRILTLLCLVLGSLCSTVLGQDSEVTNFKSGIDLNWSGQRGSDFAEEYLYFDKKTDDHKVVYLKAGTKITMSHNERNIAGSAGGGTRYEGVSVDVGTIRYRIDGDQRWQLEVPDWPAYSGAFSFSSLDYGLYGDGGTRVVGATGSNGIPLSLDTKLTRYHRGMLDSVGDEWHTLTVVDDDRSYAGNKEWAASDGKIICFVVNPKTPALTWRVSGDGQFYTTPPKKYFVPIIYDQTTYLDPRSGGVSCEIRDINGNNVFYRINGGDFINSGSNFVVIDDKKFNDGTNKLEYYYAGRQDHTKTRMVVKSPAYPSAVEQHGDRLWINADHFKNEVKPRVLGSSVVWWVDQWRKSDTWNQHNQLVSLPNGRRNALSRAGLPSAMVARLDGMNARRGSASKTFAQFAKTAMMECPAVLDPVNAELNTSGKAIGCREIIYRGYYDLDSIVDCAATYDIVAGYFREDQGYDGGLTPIEDFYIRDTFAKWVHLAMLDVAGYSDPVWDEFNSGGMWDTARKIGAAFVTAMMPSYSTEYFGTSGMDGNTKTYPWTPFANVQHTWKEIFFDNDVRMDGFPDVHKRLGIEEYNFTEEGKWTDRRSYTTTQLMGHCLNIYANLLKLFQPNQVLPNYEKAMIQAAKGQLYGLKITAASDSSPVFRAWAMNQSAWFPEFRSIAQPKMLSREKTDVDSLSKQLQNGGVLTVMWYNHELPVGNVSVNIVPAPEIVPRGGEFDLPQMVSLSVPETGAVIRYTEDGSVPTAEHGSVYEGPFSVGNGVTIVRAVAVKEGRQNSRIVSASFKVGSVVADPIMSPAGGTYLDDQEISLSCSTVGSSIYFTLDESDPQIGSNSSRLYEGPISIKDSTVIRAKAFKPGSEESQTVTESYSIGLLEASDSNWVNVATNHSKKVRAVDIDVIPGVNVVIGLAPTEAQAWSDLAPIVRFNPSREIDARNGSAYQALEPYPYEPGKIYHVTMIIDMESKTYSVKVVEPGSPSIWIARDFKFRSEQSSASELNYFSVWSEVGTTLIEDVRFGSYIGRVSGVRKNQGN